IRWFAGFSFSPTVKNRNTPFSGGRQQNNPYFVKKMKKFEVSAAGKYLTRRAPTPKKGLPHIAAVPLSAQIFNCAVKP
ncbi:MAG: hypothetical protein LUI10_04035, partial [Lachnospiraceae bacterium]|nr:hypothetical protein [Lachnospiraceae bacterium]